jgi:hypothetical protein
MKGNYMCLLLVGVRSNQKNAGVMTVRELQGEFTHEDEGNDKTYGTHY